MLDNRNTTSSCGQDSRGTVCIDTKRVFDSCRDRDCFENVRVYLTTSGEEIFSNSTNVRTRSCEILWAYVGVDDVPFNCGFYRVTVRYYILVEIEACQGIGRSQTFKGLAVVEKEVILYGGEGNVKTFSSSPDNSYCSLGDVNITAGYNTPTAIVETVEPVILGTKVVECGCPCATTEYIELPTELADYLDGELVITTDGPKLYISLGIFSVIRIVRSAQLLVSATDYCVPDKECIEADNDEDPCSVFRSMAFPTGSFCSSGQNANTGNGRGGKGRGGNCGCGK